MNIFKCDVCGAEIIREPFNKLSILRKNAIGNDYENDNGSRLWIDKDVCDKCFREKLAEVLNIPKDCRYSESLAKTTEAEK